MGLFKETRTLLDADPALANTPTEKGDLPLHLAAGRQGLFKLLLRRGADIHAKDARGYTALLAAREAENEKAVQELLQRGVPDDIFGAIAAGDMQKVKAFLQADPNQAHPIDNGPAPIMWAVRFGHKAMVELLLEQRVEVDIWRGHSDTHKAHTPLNVAIDYQYTDIVRRLLEYGADPDPEDLRPWPGHNGPDTPLFWGGWDRPFARALRWGNLEALELLLDAGADINRPQRGGLHWPAWRNNLPQAKFLIDRGADLRLPHNVEALIDAAEEGYTAFVELLATHGADVQAKEKKKNRTALRQALKQGQTETVALLRELIDLEGRPQTERERILRLRAQFIDAAIDGEADVTRDLLEQDPTLLQREMVRTDLFHHVAYAGHQAVADVLVEYGTPWTMTAAVALGRVDQVEAMIEADPTFIQRLELFRIAAKADQGEVIGLLLDRGMEIDKRSPDRGNAALHEAVNVSSVNAVDVLLSRGAQVNIKNRDGRTPLGVYMFDSVQRDKIRAQLLAHGATR
ncbi:MAG: hypothetical protein GKR89_01780 [Candidatus Latescibacteria bacterium]|nr:hypothetical protein [Candidatus Latescibacterota bacterium]